MSLDVQTQASDRGLDRGQCTQIRHPEVLDQGFIEVAGLQFALNLRPGTMDQHQSHAEAVQEREVVDERVKARRFGQLTAERHHEHATIVGMDVRGTGAQCGDKVVGVHLQIIGPHEFQTAVPPYTCTMTLDDEPSLDFDELDQLLQRLGYTEPSSHFHGALCGALCRVGPGTLNLSELLGETAKSQAELDDADRETLNQLGAQCAHGLTSDELGFAPLLPDDGNALPRRVEALAAWCGGFLFGLSSRHPLDRDALSGEAQEAIDDLSEFTRAGFDPRAELEGEETAYAELVEYVRVAAQLLFYELNSQRPASDPEPLTLH